MELELKNKDLIEDLLRFEVKVTFDFGFSQIISNIVWTQEDVNLLKEQIDSLNLGSTFGSFSPVEPDLSFVYFKEYEEDDEVFTLYITLDSGQINNDIGTDTGPTLKMAVTKEKLVNWINEVEKEFCF